MGGLLYPLTTLNRAQTLSLTPTQHSDISVSLQTDALVGELFKFGHVSEMSPSPSSSTWTSTSVAKVKTNFHVRLNTKTSYEERCPHGGAQVEAEMTHNGAVV